MRPAALRPTFLVLCVSIACLACSWAFAQDPAALPPPPPNPNPGELLAWCSIGYVGIGALVSVFRPDNTALRFVVSTEARALIAGAGTLLEACLLAILNGTPWAQAIAAAMVSGVAAFATHGARVDPGSTPSEAIAQKSRRPPPMARGFVGLRILTVLTFFVCSAFACGILRPGSAAEQLADCEAGLAEAHPDYTLEELVAASLTSCGTDMALTVVDILDTILASHDPHLARYHAGARATRDDPAKLGALREKVGHR